MPVSRTNIETSLDEIISHEEGMRFQGLAVVLGKLRWPELIAHQRKKDLGLDAYAPASETPELVGKGLAASITPTERKISGDVRRAKENFLDLKKLLFVTPAKVGNSKRKQWEKMLREDHNLELILIEREEIITLMMMPENVSLCSRFLYLDVDAEPQTADLIERTRRAANAVTQGWAVKTKGYPLIDLAAARLDPDGAEAADLMSLEQIDQALGQGGRIVLEGPAGRGKTTSLIQLAERPRAGGTAFIVELPAWTTSRQNILEYIAGMPAFLAEGITPTHLAQVQQAEPFLFLLNGWNEIAEATSPQANDALRDLDRDFPGAGIIVATRAHHLSPPMPGALRLRLLRLRREQRAGYLNDRLGAKAAELRSRIDADPSLDQLTRTPFILAEVATLFEAREEIPSTKFGVLTQVLRLHERRDEHRNSLQTAPIYGRQTDYLTALATEMTRRGAVTLSQDDALALGAAAVEDLVDQGKIERTGAPGILSSLTAHHLLERVEYPETEYRFEHQQFQEYYAALHILPRLLSLLDDDSDSTNRFTTDYVNNPAWAEPLRMIAEMAADQAADEESDGRSIQAGARLVNMALAVDLVFAGELAQLCGAAVWNDVRAVVDKHFRNAYEIPDENFRQYAVAAMLATGSQDFLDIVLPLWSGEDRHARLRTYRLWPNIRLSSFGSNWREEIRAWNEEARADFVSELLHRRVGDEIADFAVEDDSIGVKKAAASGLWWSGSDDALTRVLESMDERSIAEVARENADRLPPAFRPKAIAAMRRFLEGATDQPVRLQTAVGLIELGDTGLDNIVKDAMAAVTGNDMRNLYSHNFRPALTYLCNTDPIWTSVWVATKVAEGVPYADEEWLPFATDIPEDLVETYLHRLETEDLSAPYFEGMTSVIVWRADAKVAARVFAKLRELRGKLDAEPSQRHEFERNITWQLGRLFRRLPDDIIAAGVLSSVTSGNSLDIKVAADLLSKVARPDSEPLCVTDGRLKESLRAYLKRNVDLVLRQDDFNGEEKANLASSIAQVGNPGDMADLITLIRADIERMRRGRAALAAGDRGPVANGGSVTYAGWHVAAVMQLDPTGAEQVLFSLLPEPEYALDVAGNMARQFAFKPKHPFDQSFRYDLMWAAREGGVTPLDEDDHRRMRFAAALNTEIERLREQTRDAEPAASLKGLASALAAIDGRRSAAVVLDEMAAPGQWHEYTCLDAAKRLLMAGVTLPAAVTIALVDSVLERTERWMTESDRHLLCQVLALCPFVDDPSSGIAKMREVIARRRLRDYDLRELITALGESRSNTAVDLLSELASDPQTFGRYEDNFINAFAALDTPSARALLLGFVDPDVRGLPPTHGLHREDVLVVRVGELAQHRSEVAARLRQLCEHDLPASNRHFLSKVMFTLGTHEDLIANLNLIDDARSVSIPQGVRDQIERAFVERQPYRQNPNIFTVDGRASNELRAHLFKMVHEDRKRQKSALMLLGQIEYWRLQYGRPTDELRHPDLPSRQPWPPTEF